MNEFIKELILRWGKKQPWFFKVVQWIMIVVALILGLPEYLQDAGLLDQVPIIEPILNKVVLWAGLVGAFVSKLTVTSKEKEDHKIKD